MTVGRGWRKQYGHCKTADPEFLPDCDGIQPHIAAYNTGGLLWTKARQQHLQSIQWSWARRCVVKRDHAKEELHYCAADKALTEQSPFTRFIHFKILQYLQMTDKFSCSITTSRAGWCICHLWAYSVCVLPPSTLSMMASVCSASRSPLAMAAKER